MVKFMFCNKVFIYYLDSTLYVIFDSVYAFHHTMLIIRETLLLSVSMLNRIFEKKYTFFTDTQHVRDAEGFSY